MQMVSFRFFPCNDSTQLRGRLMCKRLDMLLVVSSELRRDTIEYWSTHVYPTDSEALKETNFWCLLVLPSEERNRL